MTRREYTSSFCGVRTIAPSSGDAHLGVECTLAVMGTGGPVKRETQKAYSRCGSQSQGGIEHILDVGANHREEESAFLGLFLRFGPTPRLDGLSGC
eukprot:5841094-Pyramimonas_sp.AAC.1